MEHIHISVDIGYDDDADEIKWASALDTGAELEPRGYTILMRAIDRIKRERQHRED